MGKQQLTESSWMALVLKQKLKMQGELKEVKDELGEYEKLDGKPDHDKQDAALEKNQAKAKAAKTKNLANKDVANYLDDVTAEATAAKLELGKRQKAMAAEAQKEAASTAKQAAAAE